MNKAFIFDFDGVLINSEAMRGAIKTDIFQKLFGQEIVVALGPTASMSIDDIYTKAVSLGASVSKDVFVEEILAQAPSVYANAELATDINLIGKQLTDLDYKIGIVSASPMEWIQIGLDRTTLKNYVHHIISLQDRKDLAHKPSPNGYVEMMSQLNSLPNTTIILEDSNTGIQSAKSSGAYTIGFKQFITSDQIISGADRYANTLEEALSICSDSGNILPR